LDLAANKSLNILVVDNDEEKLRAASSKGIETKKADLQYAGEIKNVIVDSKLVINAVPGHLGFSTLKTVIESGKDVVDIAFFPEDLFELKELALKHKVTAVCDAGVAPGMSNILSADAYNEFEEVKSISIYVGGLPKVRRWPYEYKAGFSPIDVIEEYTRPARFIRDNKIVTMPALSDPEFIDFDTVGTLEAFNSDGLRSLMKTLDAPCMIEKTLRYPGHQEKMLMLKETGFFSNEEHLIDGKKIRPLDLTTSLLFPFWKLGKGEADLTVMRILIEGIKGRENYLLTWDLYDEYDPVSGIHSMARTTGYTATGIAKLILEGQYNVPGIHPPEDIANDHDLVKLLLEHLKERGVVYRKNLEKR
jgi:saccharopine dehydrogenase-like NADP-dependent oxidoreductase